MSRDRVETAGTPLTGNPRHDTRNGVEESLLPHDPAGGYRGLFRGFAAYPVIAAGYAPVRVAAGNASYITVGELAAVAGACAATALILSLALFTAARRWLDTDTIAVGTFLLIGWLFNAEAIADHGLWIGLRSRSSLLIVTLVVGVLLAWVIATRGRHAATSRTARVVAVALLLIALLEFTFRRTSIEHAAHRSAFLARATAPFPRASPIADSGASNVYILILDNYANSSVLASRYGVDDTPFRDSLTALGLTVSTEGRSNYGFTAPSLGSIFSGDHVHSLEQDPDARKAPWDVLFEVVRRSRVLAAFTRAGYHAYVIRSAFFEGTQASDVAEIYVPQDNRSIFVRFARLALARVVAHQTIPGRWLEKRGMVLMLLPVELAPFNGMIELASAPGRKVVVAHSLVAHGPFLVDAECRRDRSPSDDRTMYIAAIRCTNQQVLRTIREIRIRDTSPAILLLADHGPMSEGMESAPAESITADQAFERFGAFRATLLPQGVAIPDSATHVNVIRRALDALLGLDLPDVPDSSYWSSLVALEHFVPVDSLIDNHPRHPEVPDTPLTRAGRR